MSDDEREWVWTYKGKCSYCGFAYISGEPSRTPDDALDQLKRHMAAVHALTSDIVLEKLWLPVPA